MTVASALPLGRGPRRRPRQSECPRGLGLEMPSVILIETAGVCETVAVEYSVSGLHGLTDCRFWQADSRRDG